MRLRKSRNPFMMISKAFKNKLGLMLAPRKIIPQKLKLGQNDVYLLLDLRQKARPLSQDDPPIDKNCLRPT